MTALSVIASTSARNPCSRRESPRARAVLPGRPPRRGSWPTPSQALIVGFKSGDPFGLRVTPLTPAGAARPTSAPTSRALRHSVMWLEYKPSRRSTAPFTVRRCVVIGQHLQLVLRGERPSPGAFGHLGIRTPRCIVSHPTRIFHPGRTSQRRQHGCHFRASPSPPSRSLIVRAGASPG